MPYHHDGDANTPRKKEADELVDLVEVILGFNVVLVLFRGRIANVLTTSQLEDCGEVYVRFVGRDEPEFEDLADVHVED